MSAPLFVIDPEGKIFWSYLSLITVNPGADGILQALEDLKTRRSRDGKLESPSLARLSIFKGPRMQP